MDWLRWYNGTANDPKWRVVAKRAGVPLHMVLAVWPFVLENANQGRVRGVLEGFDCEDVAAALDLEADQVRAILDAMQKKVLDGEQLTGWEKRNPKREREDSSTERTRRYRERNATKRRVTPSDALDKSREDKNELQDANASLSGSDEPNADRAAPKVRDQVRQVFDHWRTTSGHEKATLTDERRKKIRSRLKRFTAADLCRAVDGACANPFYAGENDRGERYDWPETIFKTDSTVEKHIAYADTGPPGERGGTNGPYPQPVFDEMPEWLKAYDRPSGQGAS